MYDVLRAPIICHVLDIYSIEENNHQLLVYWGT